MSKATKWQKKWFKFRADSINNLKVQTLPTHLFKTWVNCLCLATPTDGIIPSTDEVSFRLRMSPKDATEHINELISLGLIDITPDKKFTPHDWHQWQAREDRSAHRMMRLRKRQRDGGVTESDASRDGNSDGKSLSSPLLSSVLTRRKRPSKKRIVVDGGEGTS